MRLQRGNWLAERGAWTAMAALVLSALIGVFDGKRATVSSGSIRIDYSSPLRMSTETEVHIAGLAGEVTVQLPRDYQIVGSIPHPVAVRREGAKTHLYFTLGASGTIGLTLQPRGLGSQQGVVSALGHRVVFDQFILP